MKRFLFLLLGCASCVSPYSISKMKPVSTETNWNWGREFVQQTTNGVTVKIAYENNNRNFGIFNVEIENNSAEPVLIAPEKFYAVLSGSYLPKKFTQPQLARDPESFYLELEKQIARQAAQETNTAMLHTASVLSETASNVASLTAKETEEESTNRRSANQNAAYDRELDTYNLQIQRLNLNDQKQLYDLTLLRKTTMPANSVIYGQVHFPRHNSANTYEVVVPVKDQLLKFKFQHTVSLP